MELSPRSVSEGYRGVELLDAIIKGGLSKRKNSIPVAVITAENYEKPKPRNYCKHRINFKCQ